MGIRCGGDWVCAAGGAFSLAVSRTWYPWYLKNKNFRSHPGNSSEGESPWSFLAWQPTSTEQTLGCPRRMWTVASSAYLTSFLLHLMEKEPLFLPQTHSSCWAVGLTPPWRLSFPALSVSVGSLFSFSKQMIPSIIITRNQPTFDFIFSSIYFSIHLTCFRAKVHSSQHKIQTL